MIRVLSTNITSPLGLTTEENYRAIRGGATALRTCEGQWNLPETFCAGLFTEEQKASLAMQGYTFFEAICIRSAREALSHTHIDVASPKAILILSTTKGNVEMLGTKLYYPSEAAQRIAHELGMTTKPIVVQNACVSGLSAQLLAERLLSGGFYDCAIVVGAEVQCKFIVAGFQSLKAVSSQPCRPFDMERDGLNPGEAAATIIFEKPQTSPLLKERESMVNAQCSMGKGWYLITGASRNDAYHNVSPSPKGDGLLSAINATMEGWVVSRLATVSVHGTATLFGDQMESVAIERAGLSDIPLSALKGYYGHTMGAAGVLEAIITMCATDDGIVIAPKGFAEAGVSGRICMNATETRTEGDAFLKLLSGFGGCNVAALYSKKPLPGPSQESIVHSYESIVRKVRGQWSMVNSQRQVVRISSESGQTPADIYRNETGQGYPKFYKMDILTRVAFVAAELLMKQTGTASLPETCAVILFGHSSSVVSDRHFLSTISSADGFFPSPSVFIYTLPNITVGEISIRHHLHGETTFYVLPDKDEALMRQIITASMVNGRWSMAIGGWVDAEDETDFECELSIYNITK